MELRMKLTMTLVLCLITGACASAQVTPEAPAALDPVGVYDFTTTVDGTVVSGTVTITQGTSGYGGSLATDATETIPVRSVAVEGQKLTVLADSPDGPVTFVMTLNGDEFAGTWSYAGMSGAHTGKRRR
jgi:type 1 fimbria pilin